MREVVPAFAVLLVAGPVRADAEVPHDFDVGLAVGYAFPIGSTEAGARLGDQTFGAVPIDLNATYRLTHVIGIGIWARYGIVIPTLCAAPSDCVSSLGSDVAVAARARFFLPRWLGAEPYADVGLGYEWFASKLADNGTTSTHTYDGPILLAAGVGMPFELGRRWTLGPATGVFLGTFVNSHLQAPGLSRDLSVSDVSLHAWLSFLLRLSVQF
jgi:hypothetical protein